MKKFRSLRCSQERYNIEPSGQKYVIGLQLENLRAREFPMKALCGYESDIQVESQNVVKIQLNDIKDICM